MPCLKKTAVLYVLVTLAFFLRGVWIGRLSNSSPMRFLESEKTESRDGGNATALGGNPRIGDINVYTHPPAISVVAPSEPEEKKKPQIVFLGAEYIDMNEGVGNRGLYRAVGVKGDGKGDNRFLSERRRQDRGIFSQSAHEIQGCGRERNRDLSIGTAVAR
jgi:hypothetical protein